MGCERDCFKGIYEETKKYLQDPANLLNLDYIAISAFNNMKASGLKKMMFGLMFHVINGLFEWAMPDIRLILRTKWSMEIRPQFESKVQAMEDALVQYSTMNIYDAMQNALVDKLSSSIHDGCQIVPRVMVVIEIDTPAFCGIVIEKILRELPWLYGVVELLAKEVGPEAVEKVEMLNTPIATILEKEYKTVESAIQDIVLKIGGKKVKGVGGDTEYLKQQAAALVAADCGPTGLLCKMDTLVNLVFLVFDKRNVQLQVINLLFEKMDDVLFSSSTFTSMFGKKEESGKGSGSGSDPDKKKEDKESKKEDKESKKEDKESKKEDKKSKKEGTEKEKEEAKPKKEGTKSKKGADDEDEKD